jgi:fructokinase
MEDTRARPEVHCAKNVQLIKFVYTKEKMNKKILGIGNAIVDVLAKVDSDFLRKKNLTKGSMKLINKSEFEDLKKNIKIEKIVAGGSVANTMSGIAYLNGNPSFIGKVNSDNFGDIYKKSLEDINVKFPYIKKSEDLPTGASIILITPDSERTMCTYLGISSHLSANDINENNIINHELIFLEGYLWDKGSSEKMFKHTITVAKKNKVKIAMGLSDIFCVSRHKEDFYNLFKNDLDILIGNENEINELTNKKNLLDSINQLKEFNKLIVITRSENGSVAIKGNEIINCESIKVNKISDLTGAGDLFAAGFLKEYLDKSEIKQCLQTGSLLASKIIQKIGARLE